MPSPARRITTTVSPVREGGSLNLDLDLVLDSRHWAHLDTDGTNPGEILSLLGRMGTPLRVFRRLPRGLYTVFSPGLLADGETVWSEGVLGMLCERNRGDPA